ncbi:hypothetical protein [Nostoc sp. WHI]|uniref:hypothetical protein n=1 Tax=Nostoc sp. WHI TaxID=2650611 RepID=UPI0018C68591|nr:hypothetical protein [Nostoc sp. WHI]MBG1266328.1 hypothetical protein [Nostoc sp. WHI]
MTAAIVGVPTAVAIRTRFHLNLCSPCIVVFRYYSQRLRLKLTLVFPLLISFVVIFRRITGCFSQEVIPLTRLQNVHEDYWLSQLDPASRFSPLREKPTPSHEFLNPGSQDTVDLFVKIVPRLSNAY